LRQLDRLVVAAVLVGLGGGRQRAVGLIFGHVDRLRDRHRLRAISSSWAGFSRLGINRKRIDSRDLLEDRRAKNFLAIAAR